MEKERKSGNEIRLPLYIGLALGIGVWLGVQLTGNAGISSSGGIQASLAKLRQVITYIENDYVDEVKTEELVESAIEKMLETLDPHTVYISKQEQKLRESELQGNFEGIGVEFNIFNDTIIVISPLSGGPSEKLGIRAGDKIIKVNDELVAGVGINNRGVITRLRGERGSEVKVEIYRNNEPDLLSFNIKRGVIPQYSVDVAYMVNDEIGYIKVSRFSATTYQEFKKSMERLTEKGMKKLILDLTGNPGGYMDRAIEMVDELLPDNKLIVFTQGKDKRYNESSISRRKGLFENGQVVVMIDEGSASASEIVAGALQDHDRALIVGRRTYGKGLVQRPMSLVDGSELRLTISRYYTPSGRSIQKPYNGKDEDYDQDFAKRIENGEVFNRDSVKMNDSLIYYTGNGRVVYGGGGIMPDVFVPLDTTYNSVYMNRLFISNTIAEYSMQYSQNENDRLKKLGLHPFIEAFEVSENMLQDLIKLAEKNKVPFNQEQYLRSKPAIKTYLKAYIGRSIWENEGFYPIFNLENEIFIKALTLFDNDSFLALNAKTPTDK